jgi:hypothetical protein
MDMDRDRDIDRDMDTNIVGTKIIPREIFLKILTKI